MSLARVRQPSEFVVVGLLIGLAALIVVDTLGAPSSTMDRGPIGPHVVPVLVAGVLSTCGLLLAIDLLRGGRGTPEDEDEDERVAIDWFAWGVVAGAILLGAVIIEPLGWVVAGTAVYFLSVWAFGSRHVIRDLVVAAGLSTLSFYGFYVGLGISLPPGVLRGVL